MSSIARRDLSEQNYFSIGDNASDIHRNWEPAHFWSRRGLGIPALEGMLTEWKKATSELGQAGTWRFSDVLDDMSRTNAETRKYIIRNIAAPFASASRAQLQSSPGRLALNRALRLLDGWGGEASKAPSPETAADARALFALLNKAGISNAIITASPDGTITFDWRIGGRKATIRCEGDGFAGYALFTGGRFRPGQKDINLSEDDLPRDFVEYVGSGHSDGVLVP